MKKNDVVTRVKLHRVVSWWLVIFVLFTILTGYTISRGWATQIGKWEMIHRIFEWRVCLEVQVTVYQLDPFFARNRLQVMYDSSGTFVLF